MVISHKRKYTFISTPKTGTHSLYNVLVKDADGVRYGGYHDTKIPPEAVQYFRFTTTRNPYDRLVSAWNVLVKIDDIYAPIYRKLIGSQTFESFVEWAVDNKEKIHSWEGHDVRGILVLQLQSIRLKGIKFDAKLRIENINEELNNLECMYGDIEVPHLLKREYKGWDYWKTPNIIAHANEYLKEDFHSLPYDKE